MKIIVAFFTILFCASCSDKAFRNKIARSSNDCSLDGYTYKITLIDKVKRDTFDFVPYENGYISYIKPLSNHNAVLCFREGTIVPSWISDKKFESCAIVSSTCNGKTISFSTSCSSPDRKVHCLWSGIVKGNKVQGTFSWLMPDGKTISYNFWGLAIKTEQENKISSSLSSIYR